MFSTITTAPSTMMPKSMAPMDSRLAEMPRTSMQVKANSSDKGNGERHDQRAAQVAEEQHQDDAARATRP